MVDMRQKDKSKNSESDDGKCCRKPMKQTKKEIKQKAHCGQSSFYTGGQKGD